MRTSSTGRASIPKSSHRPRRRLFGERLTVGKPIDGEAINCLTIPAERENQIGGGLARQMDLFPAANWAVLYRS